MERTPATKQRSPWVLSGPMVIEGVEHETAHRSVHDGQLVAIWGEDSAGWHMSISHRGANAQPGRYPSKEELAHAREVLLPMQPAYIVRRSPMSADTIAHATVFHLTEERPTVPAEDGGATVDYPRERGDVIDLGPGVFAARDRRLLCWEGENYVPQLDVIVANNAADAAAEAVGAMAQKLSVLLAERVQLWAVVDALREVLDAPGEWYIADMAAESYNRMMAALTQLEYHYGDQAKAFAVEPTSPTGASS